MAVDGSPGGRDVPIAGRNRVTAMVRKAAEEAIRTLGRPVMIQEIKRYISESWPELEPHLTARSYDYVRITISTAPRQAFVKYQSPTVWITGETQKTGFWGLAGETYGADWKLVAPEATPRKKRNGESVPSSPEPGPTGAPRIQPVARIPALESGQNRTPERIQLPPLADPIELDRFLASFSMVI